MLSYFRLISRNRLINQLQNKGISNRSVLRTIVNTPRELFVSDRTCKAKAYLDTALPIECDQTISQPYIVAYMTQILDLRPEHTVLEIGTGSGYQTAILAQLAHHVYTIERHKDLHDLAVQRLGRLRLRNVTAIVGDGTKGWPDKEWPEKEWQGEPILFDRILVAAVAPEIPPALLGQLSPEGRLIMPVRDGKKQQLVLASKRNGELTKEDLLRVKFVPLLSDG